LLSAYASSFVVEEEANPARPRVQRFDDFELEPVLEKVRVAKWL